MSVVLAVVIVTIRLDGDPDGRAALGAENSLESGPELLREPAVENKVAGRLQGQQNVADVLEIFPEIGVRQISVL